MQCLITKGKFNCPPTKKASTQYGGGSSAGIQYVDKHKFPTVKVDKVKTDKKDINIVVNEVKEL